MAIVKRKNGSYRVVLYVNGKHSFFPVKGGEEEAKQLELKLKANLRRIQDDNGAVEIAEALTEKTVYRLKLADAWELYERDHLNANVRSKSTINQKTREWEKFLEWLATNHPYIEYMNHVDYQIAKEYSRHLTESRGLSNHTHNCNIGHVKAVFKRLQLPAGLPANPFDYAPFLTPYHVSYRVLNQNEIESILKIANRYWQLAIKISLYTGLDYANVRILKWSDIERVELDGRHIWIINTPRVKTSNYSRTPVQIPIHSRVRMILQRMKNQTGYVLPDSFRGRACEKQIRQIFRRAGIKELGGKLGFHCFRHCFTHRLRNLNLQDSVMSKLLGHSSLETTDIYGPAIKPLVNAIDKLQ